MFGTCFFHFGEGVIEGRKAVHRRLIFQQSSCTILIQLQSVKIWPPMALIHPRDIISETKLNSLLICRQVFQMLLEALVYSDNLRMVHVDDLAIADLLLSHTLPFVLIFYIIAVGFDLFSK